MTNTFLQTALLRAKSRSKNKKQNGFTLIELMVVVAIVGILSGVGLPQLLKAQDKAKDSVAIATLTNAAKECSLLLVTQGDDTGLDLSKYEAGDKVVEGTCAVTTGSLTIVSEAADGRTATVTFDDGGIPGIAAFPEAGGGGGGAPAGGGGAPAGGTV